MHPFLLSEGKWKGEGMITFSMADDVLLFTTKWNVFAPKEGKIECVQQIDITNFDEPRENRFLIQNITPKHFEIELNNPLVGKAVGKGLYDEKFLAWEFLETETQAFSGYEIYELQQDGSYKMRAEFTSGDGYRSVIKGILSPVF